MKHNKKSENDIKLTENTAEVSDISDYKNIDKIIIVLQRIKTELHTRDLAELCDIHYKSIGRYLKTLEENLLIVRTASRNSSKRYVSVSLTEKGIEYDIEKPIKKTPIAQGTEKTVKKTDNSNKTVSVVRTTKSDLRSKLMEMFLTLPVRKVDYSKFECKTPAEFKTKFIEMLNRL